MDDIAEHIMRYHFHKGLNAAEMARGICEVYGPDVLKECVIWNNVKDAEQSLANGGHGQKSQLWWTQIRI